MQLQSREALIEDTIFAIEILKREFVGGAEVWTAERSLLKRGEVRYGPAAKRLRVLAGVAQW